MNYIRQYNTDPKPLKWTFGENSSHHIRFFRFSGVVLLLKKWLPTRKKLMKASKSMWLVLALFTLWFPIPASALVQFSYTGEHFENFGGPPCLGCSISGHFATAATLPADMSEVIVPLSFSFSDGRHSITDTNATYSFFWLVTGHDGRIISWKNLLFSDEAKIYSGTNPAGCQGCSVVDVASDRLNTYFANIQDHPGTWAITVSVPEPSAYALMLAGLGALTMVARGKIEQLR